MVQFEEALEMVLGSGVELTTEKVRLRNSLNRILASDVASDMDMPPFNKSAVDGYACRAVDMRNELEVIEVIPAGKAPEKSVEFNQCAKIMTGAPVPHGADVVLMVEDIEDLDSSKIRYLKEEVKDNVCYVGEDVKKDEIVLKKGTKIEPQHIAVLASVGCHEPTVYKQVSVGVISTGDELVEPDVKPALSQIRNSNAYQLLAQIEKLGAIANYVGIAKDTEESTREMILSGFDNNDVILLTGGVSMGDYDYVPQVLKELNVDIKFKSIAVQPGRPTVFGDRDKQFIFGLPGNPVSSFVQFELLVKPLIYKMTDHDYSPLKIKLPLGVDFHRRKSGRLSWMPVKINEAGEVIPLEYHGSAHINALTSAHGMISVPIGQTSIKKGDLVDVRQI